MHYARPFLAIFLLVSTLPITVSAECASRCSSRRSFPVVYPKVETVVQPIARPNVRPTSRPPLPIVQTANRPQPQRQSLELVEQAKSAFQRGEVEKAKQLMDDVLKLSPNSASAFQFRALCHFAQKDYDAAAADVYDTLLRGPAWNWDVLKKLYSNVDLYTKQYHDLSRSAAANPDSMAQHFLLGYHHLMLGHLRHGEIELKKALEIQPNEPLMVKLLDVVAKRQNASVSTLRSTTR